MPICLKKVLSHLFMTLVLLLTSSCHFITYLGVAGLKFADPGRDSLTSGSEQAVVFDLSFSMLEDSETTEWGLAGLSTDVMEIVAPPAFGQVTPNNDGSFTYKPNANYWGRDNFKYRIRRGSQVSDTATVFIEILPKNDAPQLGQQASLETVEDIPNFGIVLAFDADLDDLSFEVIDAPTKGTVSLNTENGQYVYVPNANENGADWFTFKVSDGKLESETGRIDISILPVNDAPVAQPAQVSHNEDTAVTFTLSGSDVENDTLTFQITENPTNGTLAAGSVVGQYIYTPNLNANGADTFQFTVNDGSATSAAATVTMDTRPINDPPTAANVNESTDEDMEKDITLLGSDPENDTLTYEIVTAPTNGTAVLNGGVAKYTPNADFNGSDSFTYRVSDGEYTSNTANVSVTVNAVNDAPVANAGSLEVLEDTAKSGTLSASDIDSAALTYSIATPPSNGTVTVDDPNTGAYTYTPNSGFIGNDPFTFKANDGELDSNEATVSVVVKKGIKLAGQTGTLLAGDVSLTLTVEPQAPSYSRIDIYQISGASAPTACDGSDGSIKIRDFKSTEITTTTFTHSTGDPNKVYSYRACAVRSNPSTTVDVATVENITSNDGTVSFAHQIFITSSTYSGDLFGIAGADSICNSTGSPANTWKAVLPSALNGTSERITINGAIQNMAGEFIAGSSDQFFNAYLVNSIRLDEQGNEIIGETRIRMGTDRGGVASGTLCNDWSSSDALDTAGVTSHDSSQLWEPESDEGCDLALHIICISQQ